MVYSVCGAVVIARIPITMLQSRKIWDFSTGSSINENSQFNLVSAIRVRKVRSLWKNRLIDERSLKDHYWLQPLRHWERGQATHMERTP